MRQESSFNTFLATISVRTFFSSTASYFSTLTLPTPLAWRDHLTRPLSNRIYPPFYPIHITWPPLSPLSTLETLLVSSHYLLYPSCVKAPVASALDPLSPVSPVSPLLSLSLPVPTFPSLNVYLPIFRPQAWHRGSNFRMPAWPVPLRLVGRDW